MKRFPYLLIALLGFLVAGPIGMFIGLILGIFLSAISVNQTLNVGTEKMKTQVLEGLTELAMLVMRADNSMMRSELYVFRDYMMKNFGNNVTSLAIDYLQEIRHAEIDIVDSTTKVNEELNYAEKMQVLQFLFQLAYADSIANAEELNVLTQIARYLGIRQQDFIYLKIFFEHLDQKNDSSYQQNEGDYQTSGSNLDADYAMLGVKSTDSNETVKKAYRALAVANHPDKVQHLGETARLKAEKRFSAITQAYNRIKKQRGL